jgi:putative toxin-antitoxin system antitoxin component (TIGR02293 family)
VARSTVKRAGTKVKAGGAGQGRGRRAAGGKAHVYRFRGGSLGLNADSTAGIIEKINAGFPVTLLEKFAQESDLPLEKVAEAVRIPSRTLTRRRAQGRLQPDESERLLRVSTLFEKAVALFEGDKDAALRWLEAPQPALAGMPPLEFAKTEVGAREVEDLIGRLEHGVFA